MPCSNMSKTSEIDATGHECQCVISAGICRRSDGIDKPVRTFTPSLTSPIAAPQMLVDLGQDVYQEEYERHLLAEAVTWYRLEAAEFVASSSCPDYLRKARPRWSAVGCRLLCLVAFPATIGPTPLRGPTAGLLRFMVVPSVQWNMNTAVHPQSACSHKCRLALRPGRATISGGGRAGRQLPGPQHRGEADTRRGAGAHPEPGQPAAGLFVALRHLCALFEFSVRRIAPASLLGASFRPA